MKIKTLCFILVLLVTGSMGTIHASANDQKVGERTGYRGFLRWCGGHDGTPKLKK